MGFFNMITLYFFVIIVAIIYSSAHLRSLNESDYAHIITLLCFAICAYILGYTMELNASNTSQILFWNKIEYFGIPFVSALWLTVGLMYTGLYHRYRKILWPSIYVIPFITFLLRFTNDYHHLYFSSVHFIHEYGHLIFIKIPGPWMYVQMVHSMTMIFASLVVIIFYFLKIGEREKGKIALIASASLIAAIGLILPSFTPLKFHIDYMAMSLPMTCILVSLAMFQYDFLKTKSIARSKVFEYSKDAILLINQHNKIIDYNQHAKSMLEKLNIPLANDQITKMFHAMPSLQKKLLTSETTIVKLTIDGKEQYYEISTKSIDNHKSSHGWIKTFHDVTKTYTLNKDLKQQALRDELSGLYNRRAFIQMGQEWVEKSGKNSTLHLFMMDLDHFKNVNDQYGHQTGDQVIQTFGKILKKSFPEKSLIARLGGEEFAVLMIDFNDEKVHERANLLLHETEKFAFSYLGKTFHITVSIGVAKRVYQLQKLDNLMHTADTLLYESKGKGRNCATIQS